MGDGSTNGLDTERFAPTPEIIARAEAARVQLNIPPDAPVIGFVGRMSPDKGIVDLLDAFERIRERHPATRLLLLSGDLEGEDTPAEVIDRVPRMPGVILVPWIDDVRPYLRAMDVLGFPSYREGLPTVLVEAAALEVPAVGYRVTGVLDVIEDGVTGALVRAHDVGALANALERYVADAALRRSHGTSARARAQARFGQTHYWQLWADTYSEWLSRRGLPGPIRS